MATLDERGLGQLLQTARRQAGLTQQELCQKANLSYSTLAKIERGAIKAPSIFTIQSIAAALGTGLDELMGAAPALPAVAANKKTSKSGIKFVYFDINGCLVHFFHAAFAKLAEDTGVTADLIETAFWHFNDEACRGTMSLTDFNRALAERLQLPNPIDWQKYYFDAVQPTQGMNELLQWAAEHYHVGLLTNIMPGFVSAMRSKGLLPNVQYDAIVDSSEVGTIKPEPKMYEIATERSGVEPGQILLVDDSRPNLMAAEKEGWRVLWFDDYQPEHAIAKIKNALELPDDSSGGAKVAPGPNSPAPTTAEAVPAAAPQPTTAAQTALPPNMSPMRV